MEVAGADRDLLPGEERVDEQKESGDEQDLVPLLSSAKFMCSLPV